MNCEKNDIVKVYEGETGRSARLRGAEHLKQLENQSEGSVLFKHKMAAHKTEKVTFKMEITGQFKDASHAKQMKPFGYKTDQVRNY